MKSARKEDKFLFLINLFQNLVDEKNRQRAENVINLIKQKEAEINRNNQSESNKRENKKNENKKNDKNNSNNEKKTHQMRSCQSFTEQMLSD
jgi:hypothetical protein